MSQELNNQERQIYEALKKLGASSEEKLKTADDIMRTARLPKGMVNNGLQALVQKGYVKRVAREKAAGYFLVK